MANLTFPYKSILLSVFFSLQIFVLQLSLASNKLPAQEHNFVFFFQEANIIASPFASLSVGFSAVPPPMKQKSPTSENKRLCK